MSEDTQPWEDPIVQEVREIRAQILAEHQHDLRALCKHLQGREAQERRQLVTRPPRRPELQNSAAG
jgi:bisphosphoglycerate-dependent phosphoglycerate mutase